MRGHPLADVLSRALVVIFAMATVLACAPGPDGSRSPGATGDVTIASAPGQTTAFHPAETVVATAGPISITFRNASSLPHNLTFTGGLTAATRTIVEPGASDEVALSALAPGAYPFVCTIHEGMAGTLVVQPTVSGAAIVPAHREFAP